jgi:hypothetical protein
MRAAASVLIVAAAEVATLIVKALFALIKLLCAVFTVESEASTPPMDVARLFAFPTTALSRLLKLDPIFVSRLLVLAPIFVSRLVVVASTTLSNELICFHGSNIQLTW